MRLKFRHLILTVLVLLGVSVYAQDLPKAPLNFTATVQPADNNEGIPVLFKWNPNPDGVQPKSYTIFMALGLTDKVEMFRVIKNVEFDNSTEYSFTGRLMPGEYSFYVAGAVGDYGRIMSGEKSNIIQLTIPDNSPKFIKIDPYFPTDREGNILINKEWHFQLMLKTNVTTAIKFAFDGTAPDGMVLDENKGLITWTPTTAGTYTFKVKAYSVDDPTVTDEITVTLNVVNQIGGNPQVCAKISGTVLYSDGTPVTAGQVIAWDMNGNRNHPGYLGLINPDGSYSIDVSEGNYVLATDGQDFDRIFYPNAQDLKDAQELQVACNDAVTANFSVTKKQAPKTYTVSGTVTSAVDNSPLDAFVDFMIAGVNPNSQKIPVNVRTLTVRTDANGNYSITLPDAFIYIAHARPAVKNSLYLDQFYNNVTNPTEATQLTLTGDLTGINFALAKLDDSKKGILAGQVVDSNNTGIKAQVVAFLVNSNQNGNKRFLYNVSATTDDNGNFSLANLIYGDYVILSMPADRSFAPGYYVLGDYATMKWKDATLVTIDKDDNGSITIKNKGRLGLKGICHIGGKVQKSIVPMYNHLLAQPDVLAGTVIYCYDDNGNIYDYAYSNASGDYSLSEVPAGVNHIVVDKVGFLPFSTDVTNDLNNNSNLVLDATLSEEATTAVNDNTTDNTLPVIVYPMPAEDNITIGNIGDGSAIESITVTDDTGATRTITNYNGGTDSVSFDVSTYDVGFYMITIKTANALYHAPLLITR